MTAYTPDMDARLLKYRAAGMSHRQIAAAIGSTKGSVGGRLRVLIAAGRLPATEKKAAFWTPEKIAQFRDLWMTRPDLTRRQIGDILGCTMDAVIGQLDRLDLPRRKSAAPIKETLTHADEPAGIIWQPIAPSFVPPPRQPSQCWYPLWGETTTHRYCDGTQVIGRSYCPKHCGAVFATNHWQAVAA